MKIQNANAQPAIKINNNQSFKSAKSNALGVSIDSNAIKQQLEALKSVNIASQPGLAPKKLPIELKAYYPNEEARAKDILRQTISHSFGAILKAKNGKLDSDSRSCLIDYSKFRVETSNKDYRSTTTYNERLYRLYSSYIIGDKTYDVDIQFDKKRNVEYAFISEDGNTPIYIEF